MLVFSGITGAADDVLERFLQGNLEAVDGDFAAEGGCGGCGQRKARQAGGSGGHGSGFEKTAAGKLGCLHRKIPLL